MMIGIHLSGEGRQETSWGHPKTHNQADLDDDDAEYTDHGDHDDHGDRKDYEADQPKTHNQTDL